MFIKPQSLKPGDTIGIISPASAARPERVQRGVDYLKGLGYAVRLGEHVLAKQGYLAGSDDKRLEDLHRMYEDPAVKAIFCTRGGYGTPRLLERLDFSLIRRNPKIFVGFSDVTALQLAILAKSQTITFSGPMAAVEMAQGKDWVGEEQFWDLVTGAQSRISLPTGGKSLRCLHGGKTQGPLIGGCLSLICALVGTPYLPNLTNAILLAEEVGEDPYRVDRFLTQLRHSGILTVLNGICFGQFVECVPRGENESPTVDEVVKERTSDLDIPVLAGLPYGHMDQKYTFPIGAEIELDADKGSIEVETPVVQS